MVVGVLEKKIFIGHQADVVLACQKGRQFADQLGFSEDEKNIITIVVSISFRTVAPTFFVKNLLPYDQLNNLNSHT